MNTDKTVPPPPPPIESSAWFSDYNKAKEEEANWDKEGKLRGQEEKNHLRWLQAYGYVVIVFLFFFALLFVLFVGSWTFHHLLPSEFHWLDENQLSKIQSILFSGSLGGVVSVVAQKHLSK